MGVSFSVILEEASQLLASTLDKIGYSFEPKSYAINSICWFVKKPKHEDDLYRIIWLQPSGFGKDDLFQLAVNLSRRQDRDETIPPIKPYPETFLVRLSPRIWGTGPAMDYWWHFTDRNELQHEIIDIQRKLVDFGVPFLEHPDTTWKIYFDGSFYKINTQLDS
jgi:hypothetical protein